MGEKLLINSHPGDSPDRPTKYENQPAPHSSSKAHVLPIEVVTVIQGASRPIEWRMSVQNEGSYRPIKGALGSIQAAYRPIKGANRSIQAAYWSIKGASRPIKGAYRSRGTLYTYVM